MTAVLRRHELRQKAPAFWRRAVSLEPNGRFPPSALFTDHGWAGGRIRRVRRTARFLRAAGYDEMIPDKNAECLVDLFENEGIKRADSARLYVDLFDKIALAAAGRLGAGSVLIWARDRRGVFELIRSLSGRVRYLSVICLDDVSDICEALSVYYGLPVLTGRENRAAVDANLHISLGSDVGGCPFPGAGRTVLFHRRDNRADLPGARMIDGAYFYAGGMDEELGGESQTSLTAWLMKRGQVVREDIEVGELLFRGRTVM